MALVAKSYRDFLTDHVKLNYFHPNYVIDMQV
jgi:hypothetical protein